MLPAGLKELGRWSGTGWYENARLYRITAPRADIVPLYPGAISLPVPAEASATARIVGGNGVIKLLNYTGQTARASISLPMSSPGHPHEVFIKQGGKELWRGYLGAGEETTAQVNNVVIPRTGTDLQLVVVGGLYPVSSKESALFGMEKATIRINDIDVTVAGP
jgi:hypothetical protein